jgi:hypothetical protein
MTFWQRLGRWLDNLLGGPDRASEVDPSRVDAAIRLIQSTVEDQQRQQRVRRLRVSELDEEHQERLANELRELLGKPEGQSVNNRPQEDSV